MLQKVEGVLLHKYKYGDNSAILHVYTRELGRQSMLVRSAFGAKSKNKVAQLHPLSIVDFDIYSKSTRSLHHVKEMKVLTPLHELRADFRKSAVAMFLAEILHKTLSEEVENIVLYEFLGAMIRVLELKKKGLGHFHIYFLLQYARFLGFYPDISEFEPGYYVDLRRGVFSMVKPPHQDVLNPKEAEVWVKLAEFDSQQHEEIVIASRDRDLLLDKTMCFLKWHATGLSALHSMDVLREVMR